MHIHCYQGEWGHNHKSSGITLEQSALNSRSSLARMTVERGFWTLERKTEVLIKIMWLSCYFNQWHHLGLLCPFKSTQFLWVTMENTSAMTMRSVMQDQTPPTVRLVVMVGHILGIHCVLWTEELQKIHINICYMQPWINVLWFLPLATLRLQSCVGMCGETISLFWHF